jgi:hypothetical protein
MTLKTAAKNELEAANLKQSRLRKLMLLLDLEHPEKNLQGEKKTIPKKKEPLWLNHSLSVKTVVHGVTFVVRGT